MNKALLLLIALCFLHGCLSQTCSDGYYVSPAGPPDTTKGPCTKCNDMCATCSGGASCTTFIDRVTGVDRSVTPQTLLCAAQGVTIFGTTFGYKKASDTCDYCAEGCSACAVDYDICTDCKLGWDFDAKNRTCLRATLGLTATVLALSALILFLTIITCICACKLS